MTGVPIQMLSPGGFRDRRKWERRARQLAWVSLLWHVAEGLIAVALGIAANSVALTAFGADSFIETAAGAVVLWRLTGSRVQDAGRDAAERRAAKLIAVTFVLLALYILVHAGYSLADGSKAHESILGIVLAAVTMVAMPPLAIAKHRIGRRIGSCATSSEGAQNMLCAYLSAGLLVGLVANAAFGWWWADSLTALVIGVVALREARNAWRGEIDCC